MFCLKNILYVYNNLYVCIYQKATPKKATPEFIYNLEIKKTIKKKPNYSLFNWIDLINAVGMMYIIPDLFLLVNVLPIVNFN